MLVDSFFFVPIHLPLTCTVFASVQEVLAAEQKEAAAARASGAVSASGAPRSISAKKQRRKRGNIVDAETKQRKDMLLKQKVREQEAKLQAAAAPARSKSAPTGPRSALERFLQ